MTGRAAFGQTGIKNLPSVAVVYIRNPTQGQKAMATTAGHFHIWKTIAEGPDEVAIVLEHDAIMLQPLDIKIPDNKIVVLGYKLVDPSRYNHVAAGKPTEFIDIDGHEGAHAYAITRNTARALIEELEQIGVRSAIDNDYFIRIQRRSKIKLCIASPTPAMAWLRESTIWSRSAHRNYDFIPSFLKNYK